MKEKKYKHVNEAIEDYLRLTDEELEIPVLVKKAHEKYNIQKEEHNSSTYDPGETEKMFKIYTQMKKFEEFVLPICCYCCPLVTVATRHCPSDTTSDQGR